MDEGALDGAGEGATHQAGAGAPAPPFDLPEEIPAIGPDLTGLSRADVAGSRPFLAEGGMLWAAGVGSRGGFRVGSGRRVLAEVAPLESGAAANTLLFPGVVRRDFVAPTGPVVETLVVLSRLPLVVAQWTADGRGSADPAPFLREVTLELPPHPGGAGAVGRDGQVHIQAADERTVLAMVPEPLALRVERREDGSARAVFTPAPGPDTSLLVASGPLDRVRSALTAARHLKAHAVRAAAGPGEGLVVRSGVSEIDDAVLWLRARIAGQAARALRPHVPLGLAAVGTGSREAVSVLLAHDDDTSPAYALLAARVASVLGDLGPASSVADRWAAGDVPPPSPLRALGAAALARALDRSVPPRTVDRLRELASTGEPSSSGERRLPTVGGGRVEAPASADRRWWASLLEGRPAGPPPAHPRTDVTDVRHACAGFLTTPDEAWARWRAALGEAASGSPRTLWDPLPGSVEEGGAVHGEARDGMSATTDRDRSAAGDGEGSVAAELLLGLVHGLLGIDVDAPVGRLRLAPRLPSHLRAFSVGGIPVGSCSVAFDYRREGGRHVYELSPGSAPVPPLLVLEASVPGEVTRVEVDGETAELDLEAAGGRTLVPVQLPLDRTRVVVVEGRPEMEG